MRQSIIMKMLTVVCSVMAWGNLSAANVETLLPMGEDEPWQMKYINSMDYSEPANDSKGRAWYAADYDDSKWQTLTGPIARNNRDVFSQVNFE